MRTDCKHASVGAHSHRLAAAVAPLLAFEVVPARLPVRSVPLVHSHVAAVHTVGVVVCCTYCEHESVGAQCHGATTLVVRLLAVEVVATRRPLRAVPRVNAHVSSVKTTAVVPFRTDCYHASVFVKRHRVALHVVYLFAVKVVAARPPLRAVPRVHAHVAASRTTFLIVNRTDCEHKAVGAQRHRAAALVARRLAVDLRSHRLVPRGGYVKGWWRRVRRRRRWRKGRGEERNGSRVTGTRPTARGNANVTRNVKFDVVEFF